MGASMSGPQWPLWCQQELPTVSPWESCDTASSLALLEARISMSLLDSQSIAAGPPECSSKEARGVPADSGTGAWSSRGCGSPPAVLSCDAATAHKTSSGSGSYLLMWLIRAAASQSCSCTLLYCSTGRSLGNSLGSEMYVSMHPRFALHVHTASSWCV